MFSGDEEQQDNDHSTSNILFCCGQQIVNIEQVNNPLPWNGLSAFNILNNNSQSPSSSSYEPHRYNIDEIITQQICSPITTIDTLTPTPPSSIDLFDDWD